MHEPYGGPEALQRFVDACHARGLGVCLDVVYNHLGPDGNYLGEFGPVLHRPLRDPVGLGAEPRRRRSATRCARYVVDNALMWLRDFHVDGLRLDAVHALYDDRALHVLEELSSEVDALAARARPAAVR